MRDCHPDRLMPCFQQALGLAGEGDVGVVINYLLAPRLSVVWGWQSVFGADLALPAAAGVRRTAFSSTASTTARSPPAPPRTSPQRFPGHPQRRRPRRLRRHSMARRRRSRSGERQQADSFRLSTLNVRRSSDASSPTENSSLPMPAPASSLTPRAACRSHPTATTRSLCSPAAAPQHKDDRLSHRQKRRPPQTRTHLPHCGNQSRRRHPSWHFRRRPRDDPLASRLFRSHRAHQPQRRARTNFSPYALRPSKHTHLPVLRPSFTAAQLKNLRGCCRPTATRIQP